MNVSFDVDGTIIHVGHLVERFQKFGDDVFIVTTRNSDKPNIDLYNLADALRIKHENIHFTEQQLKLDTLHNLNIQLHFDDDVIEVDEINRNSTKCTALLVNFKMNY